MMFVKSLQAIFEKLPVICQVLGVQYPDQNMVKEVHEGTYHRIEIHVGEIHWEGSWVLSFDPHTGKFLSCEEETWGYEGGNIVRQNIPILETGLPQFQRRSVPA